MYVAFSSPLSRYAKPTINLPWMVIKLQTTKMLIPEQYNITIAMQYSVVEMHHLINIQNMV